MQKKPPDKKNRYMYLYYLALLSTFFGFYPLSGSFCDNLCQCTSKTTVWK